MFEDNKWQAVTGAEMAPFLSSINPISGKHTASDATASVEWRQLPFYGNIALVRIKDSTWSADVGPFWFLAKQGRMFHLDGTSMPIHEANEAGPIKVTEDNVLEYLRFFCFFVHGDDGPFLIIEDIDDKAFNHGEMNDTIKGIIEGSVLPTSYEGRNDNGELQTNGIVLYGDALFSARFSVSENGMIEMVDDDPIAADIPVIPYRAKL